MLSNILGDGANRRQIEGKDEQRQSRSLIPAIARFISLLFRSRFIPFGLPVRTARCCCSLRGPFYAFVWHFVVAVKSCITQGPSHSYSCRTERSGARCCVCEIFNVFARTTNVEPSISVLTLPAFRASSHSMLVALMIKPITYFLSKSIGFWLFIRARSPRRRSHSECLNIPQRKGGDCVIHEQGVGKLMSNMYANRYMKQSELWGMFI